MATMKAAKLPRKLKKASKREIVEDLCKGVRSDRVKIYGYEYNWRSGRYQILYELKTHGRTHTR